MHKKQRKFQQPKCLHVITCLLFSCLVLVLEWQATLATPIITTAETTSTAAANRRLRNHEKPVRGAGGGEGGLRRSRVGGIEGGTSAGSSPCEHKSLSELIKTSPVILKALGAHIFNHDDDEDLRILHNSNDALLLKWQNEQNKVLASLKRTQKIHKFTTSSSSSSSTSSSSATSTKTAEKTRQQESKQKQQQTFSDAATNRAAMLASMNADAILITLTPETIYKGASLLKMTPNAAEHATSHSTSSSSTSSSSNNFANGNGNGGGISTSSNTNDSNNGNSANGGSSGTGSSYNSGTINSSEASYLYEGQLNATVQPLSCFDENLLKMLPSDLIIFGKLITIEEQQRQQDDLLMDIHDYTSSSSSTLSQRRQQQQPTKDVLKISINGLHRWSSQFENYIWKHLGWDDWSDFTVCSVACGKGVQQRFRRCLLDNPMVNLNMNFNNADDEDDDDVDIDVDTDVVVEVEEEEGEVEDDNESLIVDDEINEQPKTKDVRDSRSDEEHTVNNVNTTVGKKKEVAKTTTPATDVNNHHYHSNDNMLLKTDTLITGNMLHFVTTAQTEIRVENSTTEEPEVMRIFEGHFNDTFSEKMSTLSAPLAASATLTMNNEKSFNKQSLLSSPSTSSSSSLSSSASLKDKKDTRKLKKQQQQLKVKRKKHKSAKLFSTMFCEGYNIEQRNCNSFECSDDINDLLKFYRKYPTTNDETNTVSTQTMTMDLNTIAAASSFFSTISGSMAVAASSSSSSTINTETDGAETNNQNLNTFTTPINMGYVQNWHNSLNFTIMLTLRVKNDSCSTATIFSIRNSTHNLYLESCKDGLRLYLERDKTTEMLPIKFNLYDYHWHQVAISIQNGDFISIHVDCSWTNSFVVSKRLFSLPVTADVEIGRGFNGELQQLLILPEHQERYQCSEKRTSINEVKRYIIDTFIDDYAN
ncbi:hypothetical protein FF38_08528 [Lucilia cuprina]|uniref:Thrombospondin-like N-terminal domain-containing protein n=1 Tax=Lucilia cuprina TaxID=7375 RepID=A0A0L0CCG9_LUCCU|nr:hypothetical protein CVS40_10083 [Lucilia cuprina]KNC29926.1 hypothetical protein FF38_08528 [Lucilia cuprina]